MPRTFTKKTTHKELAEIIIDAAKNFDDGYKREIEDFLEECEEKIKSDELLDYLKSKGYRLRGVISGLLFKDLNKVSFDWENFDIDHSHTRLLGFNTIGDLTFLGCYAGGDWEYPVFFIVYHDGKKLRAYIPTDGNPWNTDTKEAYGNEEDADLANFKKRYPDCEIEYGDDIDSFATFECDKIEQDILKRICFSDGSKLKNKNNL